MVDRLEFFGRPSWRSIVEKNFASDSRNFVNLEIKSSSSEGKIIVPLVIEKLEVPSVGILSFGRYSSVYLSDYLDFNGSETLNSKSVEELIDNVRRMGVDVLWLSNLPVNENLYIALQEFSGDKNDSYFINCVPSVGIKCHSSNKEYLASLSKNTRRNIRRKTQSIDELGADHSVVPISIDKTDTLLRNQEIRARNANLDVISNDSALFGAFKDIVNVEDVQISELSVGDKIISQLLLLVNGKTIGVLAQSFDDAYSQYSPSFCNLAKLIEYAHTQGFKYIDLLRGNEDYKGHFANNIIEMRKFVQILNTTIDQKTLISYLENIEE